MTPQRRNRSGHQRAHRSQVWMEWSTAKGSVTQSALALCAAALALHCQSRLGDLATDPQGSPDAGADGAKASDDDSDDEKDNDADSDASDAGAAAPDEPTGDAGSDTQEPDDDGDDVDAGTGSAAGGTAAGGAGGLGPGGDANDAGQGGTEQGGSEQGGSEQGGSGGMAEGGAGGAEAAGGTGGTASSGPLSLVSSSPAAGADDVDTATHVVLTFDRDIEALSGNITVHRSVDDGAFETASTTNSRVTLSGNTLTFDLDGILAGGVPYYVTLDAGAIEASDGSAFGGLNKASNLSFATASVTLPGGIAEGLTLWLDATFDAALKTTGVDVHVWGDRSGNNYSVNAPSAGTEPDRVTSAINGLPALRFDGVDTVLEGPELPAFTRYDVFVVWQSSILAPTDRFAHLLRSGPNLEINHGHPNAPFRHAGASDFGTHWAAASFTAPAVNTPYLWNLAFFEDTDTLVSYTNGSQTDSSTESGESLDPTVSPLAIGAGYGLERHFTGDIAEIVIYDRGLDSGERTSVQNYLMSKWGI